MIELIVCQFAGFVTLLVWHLGVPYKREFMCNIINRLEGNGPETFRVAFFTFVLYYYPPNSLLLRPQNPNKKRDYRYFIFYLNTLPFFLSASSLACLHCERPHRINSRWLTIVIKLVSRFSNIN